MRGKALLVLLLLLPAPLWAQVPVCPNSTTPPAANPLESCASSMAAGSWAQLTSTGMPEAMGGLGTSSSRITFSTTMSWDHEGLVAYFVGRDHSEATPNGGPRLITYDATSNHWTMTNEPDNNGVAFTHGWDHNAFDTITNTLYVREYVVSSERLWRRTALNTWTSELVPTTGNFKVCCMAMAWWEGAFLGGGSNGSLMYWNSGDGEILMKNPTTNIWFVSAGNLPVSSAAKGIIHSIAEYNPIGNFAVFGGGSGADLNKLWRLDADRTITPLPNVPIAGVGTQLANMVTDPVSGKALLLGCGDGSSTTADTPFYQLDAMVPAYTQLPNAPRDVGDPCSTAYPENDWDMASFPIRNYGVVAYLKCVGNVTASCKLHLYKHSASAAAPVTLALIRLLLVLSVASFVPALVHRFAPAVATVLREKVYVRGRKRR